MELDVFEPLAKPGSSRMTRVHLAIRAHFGPPCFNTSRYPTRADHPNCCLGGIAWHDRAVDMTQTVFQANIRARIGPESLNNDRGIPTQTVHFNIAATRNEGTSLAVIQSLIAAVPQKQEMVCTTASAIVNGIEDWINLDGKSLDRVGTF